MFIKIHKSPEEIKSPQEWDQAEPDWDQPSHDVDLAKAKKRLYVYDKAKEPK